MILKKMNVRVECGDPAKIEELKAEGYTPLDGAKEAPKEAPTPEKKEEPLETKTKAELVKLASAQGIEGAKNFTKRELLEILTPEGSESDGADN